jgi:hypothetical protein
MAAMRAARSVDHLVACLVIHLAASTAARKAHLRAASTGSGMGWPSVV